MTEAQDPQALFFQRTESGTLLLQRDGRTVALVIRLDDRQTYAWLHFGARSEPFDDEQECCDALLDRLEAWHPKPRSLPAQRMRHGI